MSDFGKARKNYPGLRNYAYLDTASTGIISTQTRDAAQQFYDEVSESGNVLLPAWLKKTERARKLLARLINARKDEVAFAPNTSTGMNLFAHMLKGAGDVILNDLEFPSSTFPWINAGYGVHFVKSADGELPLERMEKAITRKTKIIVTSYVQYGNGFRQNIEGLGMIARKYDHYFVLNATQALGAFPVDVKKCNVDFLCFTGVKWLCAGEGAGGLYIRKENLLKLKPPVAGWFSTQKPLLFDNKNIIYKNSAGRFELGGLAFPNIFALGASITQLLDIGISNISKRILDLTRYLVERLKENGYQIISPLAEEMRSGIVTVNVANPKRTADILRSRRVKVSARGGGVRVSPHFYNNREDIDGFIRAIASSSR